MRSAISVLVLSVSVLLGCWLVAPSTGIPSDPKSPTATRNTIRTTGNTKTSSFTNSNPSTTKRGPSKAKNDFSGQRSTKTETVERPLNASKASQGTTTSKEILTGGSASIPDGSSPSPTKNTPEITKERASLTSSGRGLNKTTAVSLLSTPASLIPPSPPSPPASGISPLKPLSPDPESPRGSTLSLPYKRNSKSIVTGSLQPLFPPDNTSMLPSEASKPSSTFTMSPSSEMVTKRTRYKKWKRIFGLEHSIPFVSLIEPSFPHVVPRFYNLPETRNQRPVHFSMHNITITFKGCQHNYTWKRGERVIIRAEKASVPYVLATFDASRVPYGGQRLGCTLRYLVNVPFLLDGFPLMVIYALRGSEVVERSYPVKYILSDIDIRFDKDAYVDRDRMTVTCIAVFPESGLTGTVVMTPPKEGFVETGRAVLSGGLILHVTGVIFFGAGPLDFSCQLHDQVVRRAPLFAEGVESAIKRPQSAHGISHVALALSLTLVLAFLIIYGVYTLVFVRTKKLSREITAYYSEVLEDRMIRFSNPIINNLTSPLRNYKLPGVLTAFQLRRNFDRLMAIILSKIRPHAAPGVRNKISGDVEEHHFIRQTSSSLPGSYAVSMGPQPQHTPKYKDLLVTEQRSKGREGREDREVRGRASDESLDRHIIATLPYTRLVALNPPFWSPLDTNIPIKTGISAEARTFQSKDTV